MLLLLKIFSKENGGEPSKNRRESLTGLDRTGGSDSPRHHPYRDRPFPAPSPQPREEGEYQYPDFEEDRGRGNRTTLEGFSQPRLRGAAAARLQTRHHHHQSTH